MGGGRECGETIFQKRFSPAEDVKKSGQVCLSFVKISEVARDFLVVVEDVERAGTFHG